MGIRSNVTRLSLVVVLAAMSTGCASTNNGGGIGGMFEDIGTGVSSLFSKDEVVMWSDGEQEVLKALQLQQSQQSIKLSDDRTVQVDITKPQYSGYLTEQSGTLADEISRTESSMKKMDVTSTEYINAAQEIARKRRGIADIEYSTATLMRDEANRRVASIGQQITTLGASAPPAMFAEQRNTAAFRDRMNLVAEAYSKAKDDAGLAQMPDVNMVTVLQQYGAQSAPAMTPAVGNDGK